MAQLIEVFKVEYDSIYVRENGSWCRLLWHEIGRDTKGQIAATVHIMSDYGSWSYTWSCIGDQSVEAFLASLDSHYLGKKMMGSSFLVHDDERTQAAIKQHILESRLDGSMDKDDARSEFNLLDDYAGGDIDFREWMSNTDLCEPWEHGRKKADDCWSHFWDRLWRPMVQTKLKEMSLCTKV
jgi:hypothetical protein